jgi:hypothetical protein
MTRAWLRDGTELPVRTHDGIAPGRYLILARS